MDNWLRRDFNLICQLRWNEIGCKLESILPIQALAVGFATHLWWLRIQAFLALTKDSMKTGAAPNLSHLMAFSLTDARPIIVHTSNKNELISIFGCMISFSLAEQDHFAVVFDGTGICLALGCCTYYNPRKPSRWLLLLSSFGKRARTLAFSKHQHRGHPPHRPRK